MKRLFNFLGGYGLACTLLGFLFFLTLVGTFEQTQHGLYEVQKKYFESVFLVHWAWGVVPLPLPGVFLVLAVLAVNLVVGGLIRIRKSRATVGIIVIHLGILMMLAAAIVKLELADDGHLTLYEGERSDEFESYFEWEVVIFDATQQTHVRELIIPEKDFADLTADGARTFTTDELPFRVTLSRYSKNARPMPARAPMRKANQPLVDGWAIEPIELAKEAEQNVPGLYVRVSDSLPGSTPLDAIVWGGQRVPLAFPWGGRHWAIDLRHKRFKMPFTIVLEKFTHELHPRTGIAKVFLSDVLKLENGTEQKVKIEMNQPLRHGGLVLFQSSWGPANAGPGDPLFSNFAVVRNPSDQWPLISCIVIAIGMIIAFGQKLLKYMRAQAFARAAKVGIGSLALVAAAALPAAADPAVRSTPWDRETVELAASIAVQDGGRVKPLDTLAGFKLLKINGRRTLTTPQGEKLGPVPWLLDCLFFPETARRYEIFLVQNDEVLDAIGVGHAEKGKRDRYSFDDLRPGLTELYRLASQYLQKDETSRTPVEGQVVQLAHNAHEFEQLIQFMDFARQDYPLRGSPGLARIFGPEDRGLAPVLTKSAMLASYISVLREGTDATVREAESAAVRALIEAIEPATHKPNALALFPPDAPVAQVKEWMSPVDLVLGCFQTEQKLDAQVARLADLEALERVKADPAAFKAKMADLAKGLRELAEARGEYRMVPLEVSYYKLDFFYRALMLYGLGFLCVALSLLKPGGRLLHGVVIGSTTIATALALTGIVLRCVIRGRPPVTTLYETILFITVVAVMACAVIEWLNRQRIALAVAVTLGMLGMFLAMKYEFKESVSAGDTMPSLVAVLDTNFWLATHVTAVTTGYAAGLLASAIAHVWLIGRMLGRKDEGVFKHIVRMTYGVLLFGLLFSVVGTILGGIWANYSWGRFWGWDPKENGALLICIWELIILHARLGGFIRDFGLCVMAVLGGGVIVFSWWGVNLLGVGLHSYGFTSGVLQIMIAFYALEAVLLLASSVLIRPPAEAGDESADPVAA